MTYHYSTRPTPPQLKLAGDLIDAGGQLAAELDRKKFARSCVIVVALDEQEHVVGVGAVKERKGPVAEIGYLVVHPDHRRRGIAQELTRRRIEAATALGLDLLFTNVRRNNIESLGNLRKAGFRFWGDFLSAYHTGRVISWFYFPLRATIVQAHCETLTKGLKPAPVQAEGPPPA